MEAVSGFIFWGSKITADGDCSHEIKRCSLLGRKVMTNLDSILKSRDGVLFLPPSDVYVRSFLYLLYTLIKLYYTKALSDPASSLAPDWILLRRPRTPTSLHDSATTFHLGGLSGILQDKVRMLGALVLCSPSEHVSCCTLLTLRCACGNEWHALRGANEEPCSVVPR